MINKKLLKPGDILLFKTTPKAAWWDKLIVWGQKTFYKVSPLARYCHVALVDEDIDYMLEAVWPKTRKSKIDFSTYKQRELIEVYRVKNITDEQIGKTLEWAHEHEGEWYNVVLFITGWTDSKHSEVCSTYVSHSFKNVNLEIPIDSWKKDLILPDDYYNDPQLGKIG